MATLREEPAGTPIVVVTDSIRPELDVLLATLDGRPVHVWWPASVSHAGDRAWLPASVADVPDALAR